MKKDALLKISKLIFTLIIFNLSLVANAQKDTLALKPKSEFWKKVSFGGGLTLNVGGGFTNIGVSPTAVYNVNKYFSFGTGLQASYLSSKDQYNTTTFGGSLIALANPIDAVQLSAEIEELKVSTKFTKDKSVYSDAFLPFIRVTF
jgi:hypothetical protein